MMQMIEPEPQPHRHLEQIQYDGFRPALADAERVATELIELTRDQTVVPSSQVEFLLRRLRGLVIACSTAFDEGAPT